MHRHTRTGHRHEAAATSLEFVGVAAAAALLVGGLTAGLVPRASAVAGSIGSAFGELVDHGSAKRRVQGAREVRAGGGDLDTRVSRDEIRLAPVLDPEALREVRLEGGTRRFGTALDGSVRACAGCVSAEWDHGVELGTGKQPGLTATVEASVRAALASVEAQARASRSLGTAGSVEAAARGRAMVGAEATGAGELHVGRDGVDARAEAGAMAGGVARAEVHAGMDLFGVAISQTGKAEGWAGAGIKGGIGLHASRQKLRWHVGWGAALGLGGAAEWDGAVDISKVPATHKRLARDALRAAVAMTHIPLPRIP